MRSILYLVALRPGANREVRCLGELAVLVLDACAAWLRSSQPSFMIRKTSSCMMLCQYVMSCSYTSYSSSSGTDLKRARKSSPMVPIRSVGRV